MSYFVILTNELQSTIHTDNNAFLSATVQDHPVYA